MVDLIKKQLPPHTWTKSHRGGNLGQLLPTLEQTDLLVWVGGAPGVP